MTLAMPVVYGLYCFYAPGDLSRDSLNGEAPPTGREVFRRLGIFCAGLLLVRGIYLLGSFDAVQIALPLLGAFTTVFGVGLLSRLFAYMVTLDQDHGIRTGWR
jgi:hypothetical protein